MKKIMKFLKICRNWLVVSTVVFICMDILVFTILFIPLLLVSILMKGLEPKGIFKFSLFISSMMAGLSSVIIIIIKLFELLDRTMDDNRNPKGDLERRIDESSTVKEVIKVCFNILR